MRWEGRRRSTNVEDRRGSGGGRGGVVLGGGLGTLVIVVAFMLLGGDPRELVEMGGLAEPGQEYVETSEDVRAREFVSAVLAGTEDVWEEEFRKLGKTYEPPKLVLFRGGVQSGCGFASSQVGPFYCPADRTIYLDVAFFDELNQRFGAPGDFAQAYVIAHEVGHHVQNLLGISSKLDAARGRVSQERYNELSVRLELQADFLAGLWARYDHERFGSLEEGDIDEALGAANAIGDDTLQREAQGHVVPDSFTHGTSAQRMKWFKKGFETGDLRQGDTFATNDL